MCKRKKHFTDEALIPERIKISFIAAGCVLCGQQLYQLPAFSW